LTVPVGDADPRLHPLVSAVFRVVAVNRATLPIDHGHALHGWFMRWLGTKSATLVARLHGKATTADASESAGRAESGSRPQLFSVSGLWPVVPDADRFTPATRWDVHVTTIDYDIGALLTDAAQRSRVERATRATGKVRQTLERLRLERCEFEIEQIIDQADEHEAAVSLTVGTLSQLMLAATTVPEEISLRFDTPTVLTMEGKQTYVPLPHAVFGSVHRRWCDAGLPSVIEADEWPLVHGMTMLPDGLFTRVHLARGVARRGILGRCSYLCDGLDEGLRRRLQLLTEAAYFTGVGQAVGHGLGRVLPPFIGAQRERAALR